MDRSSGDFVAGKVDFVCPTRGLEKKDFEVIVPVCVLGIVLMVALFQPLEQEGRIGAKGFVNVVRRDEHKPVGQR
jgi:hypothetical protein